MSIFGRILDASAVERAALETLREWTPTYLAEVGRQNPGVALPAPKSWVLASELDRWPEESLPCVMLVATGLDGPPVRDGNGRYRAAFSLGVGVIVGGPSRSATDRLAKLYTAALRTVLLQHRSLGGFAEGLDWLDEEYGLLDSRKGRTLAAGESFFSVDVRDVADASAGPAQPDPMPDPSDPYEDPPTVATTDVDVSPEE